MDVTSIPVGAGGAPRDSGKAVEGISDGLLGLAGIQFRVHCGSPK